MLIEATGVVWVDYHQFWLTPRGRFPARDPGPTNGLVDPLPGGAIVHTGISTGPVRVTVASSAERLALDAGPGPDDWDDVVEISITGVSGPLAVVSLMGEPNSIPELTKAGGDYRVRVHAAGRDAHIDGVVLSPSERFLIQLWPAATTDEIRYRTRDHFGAALRAQAGPRRSSG